MNLKKVLMDLGNRLVTERGFNPGYARQKPGDPNNDTHPIIQFTEWLNNTPAAREVLAEMGIDWPVVK